MTRNINRTLENLLIWGSLGAGVALMLSNHRRLGFWVAMAAPVTVTARHPKEVWKAVKGAPRGVAKGAGKISAVAGKKLARMAV